MLSPDAICQRAEKLKAARATLESHWQEIADLMVPMFGDFTVERLPGEKRLQKVFDGTPIRAQENLGAGLWSLVSNAANQWMHVKSPWHDINERHDAGAWLDLVGTEIRAALAARGNRFYTRAIDLYTDMVGFGTGCFYADYRPGFGPYFSHRRLNECLIAENANEEIDTVFRRFKWTARQAAQEFGEERLSGDLRKAVEKEPDREFMFWHAVMPNEDHVPGRLGASAKPVASWYIEAESKHLVKIGGFDEFPFQIARWKGSQMGYGVSAAMSALPDAKMLNAMEKTNIVAAQKSADPPILVPDELAVRGLRTSPGQPIYGGVDDQGRALYQPLITGANFNLTLEMSDRRREAIREAFYWSLLILIERPNATATEIIERQAEKLRLMGPHLGRIQNEFLSPLIERVFLLLWRWNRIPEPPDVLKQRPELKIEFVSPASRAQQAEEAGATLRWLDSVGAIAQAKPEVLDNIDGDETTRVLHAAFGVPSRVLVDPKLVGERRQQRAQAEQAAQAAALAQPAAAAAKDAAQAAQIARQTADA